MLEVCVLLSLTGRQWVSRYTRFSSVGSLCVTFSDWETMGVPLYEVSCVGSLCVTFTDWETMGVPLYEVFLCWKFVCYFQ